MHLRQKFGLHWRLLPNQCVFCSLVRLMSIGLLLDCRICISYICCPIWSHLIVQRCAAGIAPRYVHWGQWQLTCWSLGCSAKCFSLKCCYWNHPLHRLVHLARPRSHSHGRSSWVQHSTTCACPRQTCTHSWDSCSSDLAHQRRKYTRCRKQCRGGNELPCRYPLWSTCVHGHHMQQCRYLVRLRVPVLRAYTGG